MVMNADQGQRICRNARIESENARIGDENTRIAEEGNQIEITV